MKQCPFCSKPRDQVLAGNGLAMAFYDAYPVNEGHVLVVPRRHVETYFELTLEEAAAMNEVVFMVKEFLDARYGPAGFNVGVNVGKAAGQTIFHVHMHVIPRYDGDVPDPRGGIRRIKKSLVPYLAEGEEA